jgi:glycosyltransferase involved in cell wall biosynthesis
VSRSVVVAATQVPFERGGAEWHAEALHAELAKRGFRSALVQVPFRWDPREEVLRHALAWRMLDFTRGGPHEVDLLIATRFPSYVARHPNKVLWLFHPFRQAYDLHDAGIDGFPDTPEGRALHEQVVALDTSALRECRRIFTTSENNVRRLRRYNGVEAQVLRLPLQDAASYRTADAEPFVLSAGRLESLKRPELLVRAAAFLPAGTRAEIVGEGTQREELERLAEALGVADRVRFRGRVSDGELRDLYARCAVVFYAPFDEDYGLVTVEAFQSRKPVVTTTDAGGPLEFVREGVSGLVTAPEPEAIGAALARLLGDAPAARRMGEAGYDSVRGLSWDFVIGTLTATA